ncbi:MAG: GntR family transcriptional regulator [Rhizobiaceae bacterium]|nr:GntR family transcriptional regulator [Rhizobiaceae bacterium]
MTINLRRADRSRPEPLWHQAEQALRALIADGTWPDGTQLPNEGKLSEMLGVSRITVRHALRNIEEAGLLRREHGRGTFVRTSTVTAGVRGLTSFTQEMADRGLVVGSRVLDVAELPASPEVATALEIAEGEPVVKLRRLRAGNNLPIGIQNAFIPAARVPGLADIGEPVPSLYELLKQRFGITPQMAREIYRVGIVSPEDAGPLEVAAGSPAFIVQRITSDARAPFEYTVSTMRGDRYEIRSRLQL